jgi:hypothetical protein
MIEIQECQTSYDDIGRIYHTDKGSYYSVTTMLGNTADKGFLDDWADRIGKDEAAKRTRVAAHMGEQYHQLGEDYFNKVPYSDVQWMAKHMFDKTIPILDKHVTKIHAVEITLFSHLLQLAGRTDAVVDWDRELAIFDFKCINHHVPEWLEDYWIQTTVYAKCLQEMYGLKAKKLVLVCANKKSLKAKAFVSSPGLHAKDAVERIQVFRKMLKKT